MLRSTAIKLRKISCRVGSFFYPPLFTISVGKEKILPTLRLNLMAVMLRSLLRIENGQSKISDDDYIEGAPELIVEIAASSASYDLHDKLNR